MADAFGGIFDDLRSVGDSISGFFDTSIGQALGKSAGTTLKGMGQEKAQLATPKSRFMELGQGAFNNTPDVGYNKSNDFSRVESEWLQRLQRFANIVNSTEVKK